jgi:predicted ATP-dependent endonuclease of OLD family
MHIESVEVSNFRKLLAVRIDMAEQTTLLVGANNSGKTSAMQALRHFLVDGGQFNLHDFTLSHWHAINKLGDDWVAALTSKSTSMPSVSDWEAFLPTLDVWLHVGKDEIHHVRSILPTLSWKPGLIGIRLRLEPEQIDELYVDFTSSVTAASQTTQAAAAKSGKTLAVHLWPSSMMDFLDRRLRKHFTLKAYVLDPTKIRAPINGVAQPQKISSASTAIVGNPLSGLVKIHEINAQRGFDNAVGNSGNAGEMKESGRREHRRLSEQLRSYYANHLDPFDSPDPSDLSALAAIEEAQEAFDARLVECFANALKEVANLGYPGVSDPHLMIATRIRPMDGLNHEAAVQYQVRMKSRTPKASLTLPEHTNGLGYQNLVSMIFQLMSFRDSWMRVGKAGKKPVDAEKFKLEPLHLVLIEEPEAHLHAQVQQVFIRKAYNILRDHPDLKDHPLLRSQMIVSTHSSHVTHETEFANLRYFRRLPASVEGSVPISAVINVSEVFGAGDKTANFARRYLRTTHCDLFFADAAILVEGPAERMLVPHFIRHHYPELNQCYLTLLEIGGAHAHRLEPLLRHLGLPTLVITDIDALDASGKAAPVKRRSGQKTNNATLKSWVPKIESVDELLDLDPDRRIQPFDDMSAVRVAYQLPTNVEIVAVADEALPYTFEDALVFSNLGVFEKLAGIGLVSKFSDAIKGSITVEELADKMFVSLKTGKKAEFALDVLALEDPETFEVPGYMAEGLAWLQAQLVARQLEVIETESAVMEDAV